MTPEQIAIAEACTDHWKTYFIEYLEWHASLRFIRAKQVRCDAGSVTLYIPEGEGEPPHLKLINRKNIVQAHRYAYG